MKRLLISAALCAVALLGGPAVAQQIVKPEAVPTQPGGGSSTDAVGDGVLIEVVVDEDGEIYEKRHYGGIIPEIKDRFIAGLKAGKPGGNAAALTWVGFQQRSLFSRVFIQTDRVTAYTIYKPDPLHILVDFPGAGVPVDNDKRRLDTSRFDSAVDGVEARVIRGKGGRTARVIITLDSPSGYLYKQEGNYVFIDIER